MEVVPDTFCAEADFLKSLLFGSQLQKYKIKFNKRHHG